jgi:hypothetical protein
LIWVKPELAVPSTALQHFLKDMARARAIVAHADPLPVSSSADHVLRSDLFRSAWMFAVGALDAYFCDAYTDIVAATVNSKSRQQNIALPDWLYDIRFPVAAILEEYAHSNWRWRMAARKMMERETVLSLDTIRRLFNKFFRKGHRFFGDLLDSWIVHGETLKRLFGVTAAAYQAMTPQEKGVAREAAQEQLEERFAKLFQRRHDCIHNCDRPKVSPRALKVAGTVLKVIQDVDFLVKRCDEHIDAEFRQFLKDCGCTSTTISASGY